MVEHWEYAVAAIGFGLGILLLVLNAWIEPRPPLYVKRRKDKQE